MHRDLNKISRDYLNYFVLLSFFFFFPLVFDLLDACICQLWLGMLFRNIHCVCHNGFDLWPNGTLERSGCDFDD